VRLHGARRWSIIADGIPGRSGKQARERYLNQLSPSLSTRAWTAEEDRVIMDAQAKHGNAWAHISSLLAGRSDNAVKNRFNTTIRRRISEAAGGHVAGGGNPRPGAPPAAPVAVAPAPRAGTPPPPAAHAAPGGGGGGGGRKRSRDGPVGGSSEAGTASRDGGAADARRTRAKRVRPAESA